MEEGGDADMVTLANNLYALMQGGSVEQVSNFIRENLPGLEMAAAIPDSKFNMLRGALRRNAQTQQTNESPPLGSGVTTNPGFDPATNTYTPPTMAGGGIMSLRGY